MGWCAQGSQGAAWGLLEASHGFLVVERERVAVQGGGSAVRQRERREVEGKADRRGSPIDEGERGSGHVQAWVVSSQDGSVVGLEGASRLQPEVEGVSRPAG